MADVSLELQNNNVQELSFALLSIESSRIFINISD